MALSGSITTGEMSGRSLSFQWTATQNVSTNQSTISWKIVATGSYSGGVSVHEITVKINGAQVYHTDNYGSNISAGTVIQSGTWYQTHSSDGTGTFNAYIGAGIYYQWTINTEQSGNFTLNQIPRASSISISNGGLYLGDTAIITVSSASTSFSHKVTYSWGGQTGTIADGKTGASTYSISWNTADLAESFAKPIPNANIGYGTLTCITYNGGSQVGSKSITFYGKIKDSVMPVMGDVSATIENSYTEMSDWTPEYKGTIAVMGVSKLRLSCTATGQLSATISRYDVQVGNSSTVSISGTSLDSAFEIPISTDGYKPKDGKDWGYIAYTITAVDSRGRIAKSGGLVYLYKYAKPQITSYSVSRASSDASNVLVNVAWTYSDINSQNECNCYVKYRERGTTNWTSCGTVENSVDTTLSQTFSDSKSYEIQLSVEDTFYSAEATSTIATKEVLLDFGANGTHFGIGKIVDSEEDNIVEIHEDWSFKTHGSEILDLIDTRAKSQADTAISAYKPAVIEETHTITGLGYSFVYLDKKSGYELAGAYSVRSDNGYPVNAIQWNYKSSVYTIILGSTLASGATTNLRLVWVKT